MLLGHAYNQIHNLQKVGMNIINNNIIFNGPLAYLQVQTQFNYLIKNLPNI
jgi:hypothetical protein